MLIMKSTPFNDVDEQKQMYELVKPEPEVQPIKLLSNPIKDAEEKEYLICFSYEDEDTMWHICKGRTETYEYIIDILQNSDCYINDSFVLVEGAKLEERVSLYSFMKYCKNFYNDGFDIDEYIDAEDHVEPIRNPDRVDINLMNMISLMNQQVEGQDIINKDDEE